jgi:hypothetical protein
MKKMLICGILFAMHTLQVIAEPLVTVDRERILEICRDAITGKYKGIERASIKFKTLSYEELSNGDKILEVKFDVPLAQKTQPSSWSKNSVTVKLLASGGIIRVGSSQERMDELKEEVQAAKAVSFAVAGTTNVSVYAKAKEQADMIVGCTVVDEGPLGDGKSVQKSYQIKRDVIYSAVGWKLPETFWIHFDSAEYPKEIQSGRETTYHKGDRFIAFLGWRQVNKGGEFRIVRLDDVCKGDAIRQQLELTTEPPAGGGGKPVTAGQSDVVINHEYLSAHGFVESEVGPGIFSLLNVRLGDAATSLGFSLSDLRPTPSQPLGSDVRTVKIRNLRFVVQARIKEVSGKHVAESLDDPNSICTISVALNQVPPEREMQKK